ncbi:MAG: glutathione S-transferase family protein [Candidatus Sericytochromatia bacterium]
MKLITIYPSHYCLKARWALDYFNVEYEEESHPPVFHMFATQKYGGRSTPILKDGRSILKDSTDILRYLDSKYSNEYSSLYPKNVEQEVLELEDFFDEKLGPHTRRAAYSFLLEHKDLALESLVKGSNFFESSSFNTLFPVIKFMLEKNLNISPKSLIRSLSYIDKIFEKTEEILGNKDFLTGNDFTAADLTLCSLSAPIIFPEEYEVKGFDKFPDDFKEIVFKYRKTKLGEFILDTFKKFRFKNKEK